MLQKKWYYYLLVSFLSCVKILSSEEKMSPMEEAVKGGISKIDEWLTTRDIGEKDTEQNTILFYAIGIPSLSIVQHLVAANKQQEDRESADKNILRAIHDAISRHDYYSTMRPRLMPDGSFDDFSKEKEELIKITKFLVEQDIENIHKKILPPNEEELLHEPYYDSTAFEQACIHNIVELVEYFGKKKSINKKQLKNPLYLSIVNDLYEMVEYLIKHFEYNFEPKDVEWLLKRASHEMLKRLFSIDQLANLLSIDNDFFQQYIEKNVRHFVYYTALIHEVVKEYNNNVKSPNWNNGYANDLKRAIKLLTVLVEKNKISMNSEYAERIFLIACNQPYGPSDFSNRSGRDSVSRKNSKGYDLGNKYINHNPENLALIELMLKKGISLSFTNSKQQTGLMLAAMNGKDNIVTLLLNHIKNEEERKKFVDLQDENGMTAWMLAWKAKHTAVANLLQNTYHADVNKKNKDGETGYTLKPDERNVNQSVVSQPYSGNGISGESQSTTTVNSTNGTTKINKNTDLSNKDTQKSTNNSSPERKLLSKTEITLIIVGVIGTIVALGYRFYKKKQQNPVTSLEE